MGGFKTLIDVLSPFDEVWGVDFEFSAPPGEPPDPLCMVAREFRTGRIIRLWRDDLKRLTAAPFPTGKKILVIAYYASAEMSCFIRLGWPLPVRILDLFTEFRNHTNGNGGGAGLIHALRHFGLASMESGEKDDMRDLAMRGGRYSSAERKALLDYCQSDVDGLSKLLGAMLPNIDLPRAILRGRYMRAVAHMEHNGVPIDVETLNLFRRRWHGIQNKLVMKIDKEYGVYEGTTFKIDRFEKWLIANRIPWPRLESGKLDLTDDTFRDMAKSHPAIAPLRELRFTLSQMRLNELAVGADGRNRTLLSAFRARTGRNQPGNSRFIFGPAVWVRGLIRPTAGHGVAYIDYSQQEFGIAAALSGDRLMMEAYRSGDPYLEFAKQAGAAPPDATKNTHGAVREQFKACVLAVQYGMGEASLAARIGQPVIVARRLLKLHHETYAVFWRWSDAALDHAMLYGSLHTVFGWKINVGATVNPRSLRNFPMQANGAEMLRLACIYATERGIKVCAPVHDAVLIESPLERLDADIEAMREAMAKASRVVLDGFELRTGVEQRIEYPDRYMDKRGIVMWDTVMEILASEKECADAT